MREFIGCRLWDVIIRVMYKNVNDKEDKNDKYASKGIRKVKIGLYIDDLRLDEYDDVKEEIKSAGFTGNPLSYRKDNIIWVIEELDEEAARVFDGVYWSVSDKKHMPTKVGILVNDISIISADIIRYISSYDRQKNAEHFENTAHRMKTRKPNSSHSRKSERRIICKKVIKDKIKCYVGDEISYSAADMRVIGKQVHSKNPNVAIVMDEKIIAKGMGEAELIWGNNDKVCNIFVKSSLSRFYYWELFVNTEVILFILGLLNLENERQCLLYTVSGVISGIISLLFDKYNRKTALIFIVACVGIVSMLYRDFVISFIPFL